MSRFPSCLAVLAVGALVLFGCATDLEDHGTLEGHVTIGPLLPVIREGEPEPTPAPEVYAARAILVFRADGKTEVAHLKIDRDGEYRVELPAGRYVVDINHVGIDSAAGLPREVEITPGDVTTLDIDIDTGIR